MAQPPNPRANLVRQRIDRWNQFHPQHAIDPQAALAVASREGLSGRVGDSGHAFGNWQLNDAGGGITGKFPNWNQQQKQTWADSPAGIDYALAGIAKASGGQRGAQAVRSIVTNFERPANIPGEIAGALGAYGQFGGGGRVPGLGGAGVVVPSSAAPAAAAPQFNPAALLKSLSSTQGGDYSGFYQQLGQTLRSQQAGPAPSPVAGQLGQDPQATTIPQTSGPHVSPVSHDYKFGRIDQGVDVSQAHPYVSPGSGTVTRIGKVAGGTNQGVYIKLDHPIKVNGRTYPGMYVWHTSPLVKPGQRVKAGQPIMSAGSAEVGFATADGRPVAPLVGGLGAGTKSSSQGADMKAYFDSLLAKRR